MKVSQETADGMQGAAMRDGLRECTRLNAAVNTMRDLMRQMKPEDQNHNGREGAL